MNPLLHTPFYSLQKQLGARFVPFAGYEMPVQFSGLVNEHNAVRQKVGLFDVSHMGEAIVSGKQALEGLQYLLTNDVAKLTPGKALYTVMCVENGGIVDDLIVYCETSERYFLCINASRRFADIEHMQNVLKKFDCKVEDCSDNYAQLALQGPQAKTILSALAPVHDMPSFSYIDTNVGNVPNVRVTTTGYTGEHGYELYCAPQNAEALYQTLMQQGEITPCGLGARDTLRLEMKYALYGNDIDLEHNPIEAGLGWVVKFTKGDFMGRSVLEQCKQEGPKRRLVGLKVLDKGIARHGYSVQHQGENVGVVTSGTHSPTLGVAIAMAYVPTALSKVGTALDVIVRDKAIKAEVVETPFYKKA